MSDETPVTGTIDDPIHVVTLSDTLSAHEVTTEQVAHDAAEGWADAATGRADAAAGRVTAEADQAALIRSMSELAASNRDLATAAQAAADVKAVRRRQLISLIGIAVLLLAVLVGSYEGRQYIDASNHRASVNSGILQRLDANTDQIKRTNEKIDLYTTGAPAADAKQATLQLVLCIDAKTANIVRGDPIPAECAALGIR